MLQILSHLAQPPSRPILIPRGAPRKNTFPYKSHAQPLPSKTIQHMVTVTHHPFLKPRCAPQKHTAPYKSHAQRLRPKTIQHMLALTRGTAYTLCISQAAITLAVISYFPHVTVEVYTAHPTILNGTLQSVSTQASPIISSLSFSLALPFLMASCLAAAFSTTTAGLIERGTLATSCPYSHEYLSETGMWDLIFWLYCSAAHVLLILIVMSPADTYAVTLASLLTFYFLGRMCQPREGQINMTWENINFLGLCSGLAIVFYNLPDSHNGRLAAIFVVCILDYMLGVGHTWDACPTMDVITNCRLFWVCSASLCLSALYGAWHDHLLMEPH
jgi:hypothetical protein